MSVLFSVFIDPNNATIARVADHVEHIAAICGKAHVGLGSDFDVRASDRRVSVVCASYAD